MACQNCNNEPCTCHKKEDIPTWLITHCSTPGCEVAIRYRLDRGLGNPICKWCQAGVSHVTIPTTAAAGVVPSEIQRRLHALASRMPSID